MVWRLLLALSRDQFFDLVKVAFCICAILAEVRAHFGTSLQMDLPSSRPFVTTPRTLHTDIRVCSVIAQPGSNTNWSVLGMSVSVNAKSMKPSQIRRQVPSQALLQDRGESRAG